MLSNCLATPIVFYWNGNTLLVLNVVILFLPSLALRPSEWMSAWQILWKKRFSPKTYSDSAIQCKILSSVCPNLEGTHPLNVILSNILIDRVCSTAVERMPLNPKVVGLSPAGCWALFSSLCFLFHFHLCGESLKNYLKRCPTSDFIFKRYALCWCLRQMFVYLIITLNLKVFTSALWSGLVPHDTGWGVRLL